MNPEWNECLSFRNIDDEDLQEKYFDIMVMDKDHIVKDKMIGTVQVDLSPLLTSKNEKVQEQQEAWYPIYNFEKGLRGDLHVEVKISLIKDENAAKFISSTEVQLYCNVLPSPSEVKYIIKMVEELIEFKRRSDDKVIETMTLIESRSLRL